MVVDLVNILSELKAQKWIELTQVVSSEIPYFPAFKPLEEETLFTVEADGFFAKNYQLVSQYGTHIDPPVHFSALPVYVADLPLKDLFLPLIVLHLEDAVAQNHDYVVTVEDILAHEAQYGIIPAKSFVAFSSGWSERWEQHEQFYNQDEQGQGHTPGWSLAALKFLHEERQVQAIGHETLDTDAAVDATKHHDLIGERYWLSQGNYQVEVLKNLRQIPATGSLIAIGVPKIANAPGFTVRAFAIVPSIRE